MHMIVSNQEQVEPQFSSGRAQDDIVAPRMTRQGFSSLRLWVKDLEKGTSLPSNKSRASSSCLPKKKVRFHT